MTSIKRLLFAVIAISSFTFVSCGNDDDSSSSSSSPQVNPIDLIASGIVSDSSFTFTSGYAQESDFVSTFSGNRDFGTLVTIDTRPGYNIFLSEEEETACFSTPGFGIRASVPGTTVGIHDSISVLSIKPGFSSILTGGPSQVVEFTEINDSMILGNIMISDSIPNFSTLTSIIGTFEVPICEVP